MRFIGLIIFLHFFFLSRSQQSSNIIGQVKDSLTDASLSDAIIICTVNSKHYYSITDSIGNFTIVYYTKDSLFNTKIDIVIKLIGYAEKKLSFNILKSATTLPPIFLKSQSISLSEIIVQSKPVTKHGDTTQFIVGTFKNKLDANLEDVLKKMPGMDVDESGNIRYNNKPIENIMIEGDVLSKNYKLISKNITPDMVDKVEMIDKYNSNSALNGLTNSQKQIMNLVLKNPKKLKKFGTVKIGAGIENKLNATGSLFVLNNSIKTMTIFNKNNIGQSPYFEYSFSDDFAKTQEYEFTPTIIPTYITENTLFAQSFFGNNVNSLFNKSNLGVFNNSVRLNKNTSLKLFTDIYNDNIYQYQQTINQNNLYPQFSYNENIVKHFLPINFNNNIELKQNTKKSQLLASATFINKSYKETNDIISTLNSSSNLVSSYTRLGGAIYYTHRIDSARAYEVSYQYIFDKKKQQFSIYQNQYRILDSAYLTNYQFENTANTITNHVLEIKYLFKQKRINQLTFKDVFNYSNYNASLQINDTANNIFYVPKYLDSTIVKFNNLSLNYNISNKFKKISFIADFGILLNNYSATNALASFKNKNKLFAIPQFKIIYIPNSLQQITANFGWGVDNPNISNINLSPLLVSYRTIKSNVTIPLPIQNFKWAFNYVFTNLASATSVIAAFTHATQSQITINNYFFTQNFDYYQSVYEPIHQNLSTIFFKYSKYFNSLNTSISLKNTMLWYQNPIEVLSIMTSKNFFNYTTTLSIRPSINNNVNFYTGIDYKYNLDITSKKATFQLNPFADILISANKKISLGGRVNYFYCNYFLPNKKYDFINLYAWYTLIPKKLDAKFSVFNLLNANASFSGYATNAITQSLTTRLLARYVLLELQFKF